MVDALAPLALLGAAFLLAAALALFLRRPRLSIDLSLRGSARSGTLYIVLTNRGRTTARAARVAVAWVASDGRRAHVDAKVLDEVAPSDALRLEVSGLHAAIADAPAGWSALEVVVRARNALPARASLPMAAREGRAQREEPVRYAGTRELPCPESPDGNHRYEVHRVPNDGVVETWRACGRCRHVVRDPLSPEEKEVQTRIRRERAERLRREMEVEFARRAAEEGARERPREASWGWWREAARDEDTLPPQMAFHVLELDPTSARWEDVLAAHRRLALAHHPDRRPGADAATRAALERKMQEINSARDRLREHFGVKAPMEP